MAEEAPAAAPAKAPAKSPKKKAVRSKTDGPSLPKLIVAAVAESKERKGISLAAIKKVLAAKKVDVAKSNKRINTAVTKMVTNGVLIQTKGTGASGSFKLTERQQRAYMESGGATEALIGPEGCSTYSIRACIGWNECDV
uniref:H15 domain-containing protein n=1 Tax=Amphiprion ocellaris TaxID=80972 RepID=A0AAQ5YCJ2_AMPOC